MIAIVACGSILVLGVIGMVLLGIKGGYIPYAIIFGLTYFAWKKIISSLIVKKYYFSNGEEKLGPFSIEELKKEHINSESQIWIDDSKVSKSATEIEEIKELLELSPPDIEKDITSNE